MKKSITILVAIFAFLPAFAGAQYYECRVSADTSRRGCEDVGAQTHICQLHDGYDGSGIPGHCSDFCLRRSQIRSDCATFSVGQSSNPEAHQGRNQVEEQLGIDLDKLKGIEGEVRGKLTGIEDEINTDDGVDASEVQHVVGRVVGVIREILGEKIGGFFGDIKEKITTEKEEDPEAEEEEEEFGELTEEDFEDHSIEATGLNEYRSEKWPDEDGTKIAKVIDPYGIERYTSDGKHFYDNPYDAAHSGSGFSNIKNNIADAWDDFKGVFSFRAKLTDKDKELQREIAREVLEDAKGQREKDVDKAYEKLSDKIKAPTFGDVPAKVVIEATKEASATDFAGGVLLYIEQRKEGKSPSNIRDNFSQELSEGFGTFGEGTSLSTTNKQAEAVLYARYEETYQRYLLAKEFGREE